jgi:glutathione S-transferase
MKPQDVSPMILVGQYDSPFVRRVAIALNYFGMEFERRVLSTFQNLDEMLAINPLGKVPALILPGGVTLWESRAIIEYLEGITTSDRRLTPSDEMDWLNMLRVEAVGIGLADKTYERTIEFSRRSPGTQDPIWIERLERQIDGALGWLDGVAESEWLVGDAITRADLAVAVAATFVVEKQPKLYNAERFPRLEAHRQRCEGSPLFSATAYSEAEALATGWRPEKH